jgi:hypothetical protein
MRNVAISLLAVLLAALAACNPNDDKVFKEGGNGESKPASTLVAPPLGQDATSETPATLAATVTYQVRIDSPGAQLCKGEATIQVYSDFTLKFPDATLQCASMTLDLAAMLGSAPMGGGAGAKDPGNLTHDGLVLSVKNLGRTTFTPNRPFLLGPIVQDASKYKGFKRTTQHSLSGQDAKSGAPISGNGTFTVNVIDNKAEYSNEKVGKFDNVIHWEMTTTGFDGVAAANGLIFEKWEWFWNTDPIMVPKIVIVGQISDFAVGPAGGTGDQFIGTLTVNLVAKDYEIK